MPKPVPDIPPRKLYLELTTACNMDCGMCIRRSWKTDGGTMSRRVFEAALAGAADLPTLREVNFSGYGEPMLHPRFWDFLRRAKKAGLRAEFVTNAALLDDQAAARLVDLQADRVIVSLDSIASGQPDMLHPGPFAEMAARLRRLKELKERIQSARPEVCIEFVATRSNIHELPALKNLSVALGFSSILVTNLAPHTPDLAGEILYNHWSTTVRAMAASPYTPVVDLPQLDVNPQTTRAIERLRGMGTHIRVNGGEVWAAGPKCPFVTQGRLAVRFDGRVSPCLPLLHNHTVYFRSRRKAVECFSVGDLHEQSLAAIWKSRPYRDLRRRLIRFEFSPCADCSGCDLREGNQEDCSGGPPPRCGECLWAAGLLQCP